MAETRKETQKRAETRAAEYGKSLRAGEPGFRNAVFLRHEDGCEFRMWHAFAVWWVDPVNNMEWIFVFCEHHRTLIYSADEVSEVVMTGPRVAMDHIPR